MKFIPLHDKVLIKPKEMETSTATGIILPEISKATPESGMVVEVGKDVQIIKQGDVVLFKKYAPDEIKINNENLLIISEKDIMVILED